MKPKPPPGFRNCRGPLAIKKFAEPFEDMKKTDRKQRANLAFQRWTMRTAFLALLVAVSLVGVFFLLLFESTHGCESRDSRRALTSTAGVDISLTAREKVAKPSVSQRPLGVTISREREIEEKIAVAQRAYLDIHAVARLDSGPKKGTYQHQCRVGRRQYFVGTVHLTAIHLCHE